LKNKVKIPSYELQARVGCFNELDQIVISLFTIRDCAWAMNWDIDIFMRFLCCHNIKENQGLDLEVMYHVFAYMKNHLDMGVLSLTPRCG
jgi:hypothetical protein